MNGDLFTQNAVIGWEFVCTECCSDIILRASVANVQTTQRHLCNYTKVGRILHTILKILLSSYDHNVISELVHINLQKVLSV